MGLKTLLKYIPDGRENAISRERLVKLTGLSDRRVRLYVKRLLKKGVPVLSSSSAKGYWMSNDPDEWWEFIKEYDHRIRQMQITTAKLRQKYYKAKGIKTIKIIGYTRRIKQNAVPDGQIAINF